MDQGPNLAHAVAVKITLEMFSILDKIPLKMLPVLDKIALKMLSVLNVAIHYTSPTLTITESVTCSITVLTVEPKITELQCCA